ncbi:MOSC domain-containing protein [Mangrovicoccus sp. HB161399]|uniref:MOSC domain-containing protein n=1 Tax=Mangrovicoccus sp. HB161399 TaxID=2720392 RepID=UPI001554213D|nr:sulfurase [Mangrovicoccus sp. HB161399]
MPALEPTDFAGRIVWIGRVADRKRALASEPVPSLRLGFGGPEGEAHGGTVRPSCSRVTKQHPKGTPIRNVRQISIVSEEELAGIAAALEIDRLDPAWIGATLCLAGLPDLSLLPPSSRLQGPDGATLVVDMQNQPCHLPDRVIRAGTGRETLARSFRAAARQKRGVTAWVEREGELFPGDVLRLHIPAQPAWPHLAAARGAAR